MILARVGYSLEVIGATPPAVIGAAALYTFTARGGLSPYQLSVVSETLPAEWTYQDNGDGTLGVQSSDPQTAGTYALTVRAVDAHRVPVDTVFAITVIALPVTISFTSLPDGTEGAAYTGQATAQYGTTPYTYTKTAGPSWLTVNASTGALTGTPDADGSGITVTVQVTDNDGNTASVTDTINVAVAPQGWNPSDKNADIALSGTNNVICANSTGGAWRGVRGVTGRGATNGGRYFELRLAVYSDNAVMAGVADAVASLATFATAINFGLNDWSANTRNLLNGSLGSSGLAIWNDTAQRMMIFYLPETGQLWHGLDGTWIGDPSAGTGNSATITANTVLYPLAYIFNTTAQVQYYGAIGENAHPIPTGGSMWEA